VRLFTPPPDISSTYAILAFMFSKTAQVSPSSVLSQLSNPCYLFKISEASTSKTSSHYACAFSRAHTFVVHKIMQTPTVNHGGGASVSHKSVERVDYLRIVIRLTLKIIGSASSTLWWMLSSCRHTFCDGTAFSWFRHIFPEQDKARHP